MLRNCQLLTDNVSPTAILEYVHRSSEPGNSLGVGNIPQIKDVDQAIGFRITYLPIMCIHIIHTYVMYNIRNTCVCILCITTLYTESL